MLRSYSETNLSGREGGVWICVGRNSSVSFLSAKHTNTQTHRMAVKTNQEMDTMHAQSVSSPRPAEELV